MGEKKRGEYWMEQERETHGNKHPVPLPPTLSIKNQAFGIGSVGSGLSNKFLPSWVWYFGLLPQLFVLIQIPLFTFPCWSQGCQRAHFLMIAVTHVLPLPGQQSLCHGCGLAWTINKPVWELNRTCRVFSICCLAGAIPLSNASRRGSWLPLVQHCCEHRPNHWACVVPKVRWARLVKKKPDHSPPWKGWPPALTEKDEVSC